MRLLKLADIKSSVRGTKMFSWRRGGGGIEIVKYIPLAFRTLFEAKLPYETVSPSVGRLVCPSYTPKGVESFTI